MQVASLPEVDGVIMPSDHGQGDVRAYRITESLLKRLSMTVIGKHRESSSEPSSEGHNHRAYARNITVRRPLKRPYCADIDDDT